MQPSRIRPLTHAAFATSLALLIACGGSSSNSTPVQSAPTLTSVAPTTGATAGGTAITLTGANFATGATVTVGGASATAVAVNGATSITATTPAHAAGPVAVVVTNPDGGSAALASAFTYQAPAPVFALTAVSPTHGPEAGGTTVTLTGTAFRVGVGVEFDTSTASAVTVVNSTTMTATTPAHAAGVVDVTVVDLDGTRKTLTAAFTFDAPATGPVPTVTGVAPSSGPTAGTTSVVITGTNFVVGPPGTTVTFGGSAASATVNTTTSITAITPAHAAGAVDVSTANPDGHVATLPAGFTFTAPAPTLSAVAPSRGHAGSAVALTGTGFQPNATVTFGGAAASVSSGTDTTLSVTAPAHASGAVDVRVANLDGQAVTLASAFTYVAPPTLASLSPTAGSTAGGTSVTLAGTGFVAGAPGAPSSTVSFGGATATVTSVTPTAIVVTTPLHAAAAVDVTVTNPDGQTAALPGAFTFNAPTGFPPPPIVTTLDVTSGPTAGGTVVQINGSGFTNGVSVSFGGVLGVGAAAHNIGDFVTVTTPVHAAGTVDVSVRDVFGQVVTKPGAFTFLGPTPAISTLNIHGAPPEGGTTVLVKGTNFDPAAKVTFGGAASPSVVADPANGQLIVTTPPQPDLAVEFVDVVVGNPDGQTATAPPPQFHYGPAPVVTSFSANGATSPALVAVHAGDTITIDGANFSADTTGPKVGLQVQIGKLPFATIITKTATRLVVSAPQNNPGTYPIVVSNFDGQFTVTVDRVTYPGP
jgi:IPT/TIG domain-containing protein